MPVSRKRKTRKVKMRSFRRTRIDEEQLLFEVLAHFPAMTACQSEEEMDEYLNCIRCRDYEMKACPGKGLSAYGCMDCMRDKVLNGEGWNIL